MEACGAQANAEDILALAPHDTAHDLPAAARAPNDRLDRDALGGERPHCGVRLLATEEAFVLNALCRRETRGRDLVFCQCRGDVAEALPDGVDEGTASVLQQMPSVGDLPGVRQRAGNGRPRGRAKRSRCPAARRAMPRRCQPPGQAGCR